MQDMLNSDSSFRETLDHLVSFATSVSCNHESPMGCLFVKMREARMHLGEATRAQVDFLEEQGLSTFKEWVKRSKAISEFSANMSPDCSYLYLRTVN